MVEWRDKALRGTSSDHRHLRETLQISVHDKWKLILRSERRVKCQGCLPLKEPHMRDSLPSMEAGAGAYSDECLVNEEWKKT